MVFEKSNGIIISVVYQLLSFPNSDSHTSFFVGIVRAKCGLPEGLAFESARF